MVEPWHMYQITRQWLWQQPSKVCNCAALEIGTEGTKSMAILGPFRRDTKMALVLVQVLVLVLVLVLVQCKLRHHSFVGSSTRRTGRSSGKGALKGGRAIEKNPIYN